MFLLGSNGMNSFLHSSNDSGRDLYDGSFSCESVFDSLFSESELGSLSLCVLGSSALSVLIFFLCLFYFVNVTFFLQ